MAQAPKLSSAATLIAAHSYRALLSYRAVEETQELGCGPPRVDTTKCEHSVEPAHAYLWVRGWAWLTTAVSTPFTVTQNRLVANPPTLPMLLCARSDQDAHTTNTPGPAHRPALVRTNAGSRLQILKRR